MIRDFSDSSIKTGVKRNNFKDDFNSYEAIASYRVSSSSIPSIEFNDIPQNYQHLQIRAIGRSTQAANEVNTRIRFNNDSSSSYPHHWVFSTGSQWTAGSNSASAGTYNYIFANIRLTGNNIAAGTFGFGVLDILHYRDTNKYKTMKCVSGWDANTTGGFAWFTDAVWLSYNPITSIQLSPELGQFAQHTHFALYGIR